MTASENEWDDFAAEWNENKSVREYSEKAFCSLQAKVLTNVSDLSDCRVLDFGCGTGLLAEKLADKCGQVVAIDSSRKMIDVFNKKNEQSGSTKVTTADLTVNAESIEAHPLLADKFDLIVASSVCSFLPDYETTLRHLSSLLKPNGFFVQWDWISDMPAEKIEDTFKMCGLSELRVAVAFSMDPEEKSAFVIMGIGRKLS